MSSNSTHDILISLIDLQNPNFSELNLDHFCPVGTVPWQAWVIRLSQIRLLLFTMQRLHAFYRSTKSESLFCRNVGICSAKDGCWFIFCQGWSRYSGAHVRPFKFMRLLPRGLGPDLLWLRGRLDAASTFIGQIKLKLFPITPAPSALQFYTFILIDEAILVINGSYYTRLDRTFSFYRGPQFHI